MVAAKDAVARAGQPLLSLTGVSCTAAAACTAGGIYDYADVDQSIFAMRLAGSTWAIEEQPNPSGENVNAENAVSCSGASACTVVGSWLTRELETRPLAEGWNGTAWVRQWPPHPRSAYSASLEAVSCSSSATCAAVGGWSPSSQGIPAFALAEGWDGISWRLEPAADPSGAQLTTLRAVNCPASCVAVGSYYNGSITQTLVERSH